MALRLLNISFILFLLSCSMSFDKEIINYGPNLKSFNEKYIDKGKTSKSFILNKLGPPSFINPYNNKNVFYISQEMKQEVGKVNQIQEAHFLEILYNKDDKVVEFNFTKEKMTNNIKLSKLKDQSVGESRTTFKFFKNILSNLRRQNKD